MNFAPPDKPEKAVIVPFVVDFEDPLTAVYSAQMLGPIFHGMDPIIPVVAKHGLIIGAFDINQPIQKIQKDQQPEKKPTTKGPISLQ